MLPAGAGRGGGQQDQRSEKADRRALQQEHPIMQRRRPAEWGSSRVAASIFVVTRRGADLEPVDEGFWGSQRKHRFPLSGSWVVDGLALLIGAFVVSTLVGLTLLWPHGSLWAGRRPRDRLEEVLVAVAAGP